MILATHAIVGAALATLLPREPWTPYAAVVLGFASHFVIDAIPHWDYPIRSAAVKPNSTAALRLNRDLLIDLSKVAGDAVIGLALALALFGSAATAWTVAIAAVAAMAPDPLQFLHSRFPREPLNSLQRFHVWIHTNQRMKDQVALGVTTQLLFVCIVVAATVAIHRAAFISAGGWGLV